MDDTRWLRAKEAAEYLGLHPETLYPHLQTGRLRSVKIGRTYRTTRQWCDEFLEKGAA